MLKIFTGVLKQNFDEFVSLSQKFSVKVKRISKDLPVKKSLVIVMEAILTI